MSAIDTPPNRYDLMRALEFSDADLKANRAGYMTKNQLQSYQEQAWWWLGGLVLVVGLSLAVVIGLLHQVMTNASPPLQTALLVNALIIGGMLVSVMRFLFKQQAGYAFDLKRGEVAKLRGIIRRKTRFVWARLSNSIYEIHLADEKFKVSSKVYEAFEDSAEYHIFLTPGTRTLLSAERLS